MAVKLSPGPNPPMPLPTEEEQTRGPIPSDLAQYWLALANQIRTRHGMETFDDWTLAKAWLLRVVPV